MDAGTPMFQVLNTTAARTYSSEGFGMGKYENGVTRRRVSRGSFAFSAECLTLCYLCFDSIWSFFSINLQRTD